MTASRSAWPLAQKPPHGPKRKRPAGRLYHLAWQVDTIDELAEFRQRLTEAGARTGESGHGATKSVYGVDPDGNQFEIMWMLPRNEWGTYANAGVVEFLDLPAEVVRWSGVRTAGHLVQKPGCDSMTTANKPIVVGVDGSPSAVHAARWAAAEAARRGTQLVLVHSNPPVPVHSPQRRPRPKWWHRKSR